MFRARALNVTLLLIGYGVAFPKGSIWITRFNEYLMRYRENGDLERMQRFWFTGACEPRKRRRTSSKPLALAQFMSAFLLLGIGITFSGVLLLCEMAYFGYVRRYLSGVKGPSWCNLISLSIAESLSFNVGSTQNTEIKQDRESQIDNENVVNNNMDDDGRNRKNDGRRRIYPQSNVLSQNLNQKPKLYGHNCNQNVCEDPLCERNMTAVTRELDTCNKRIEFLQKALKLKDMSEVDRLFQQENEKTTFDETNNVIPLWHQCNDDNRLTTGKGTQSTNYTKCEEAEAVLSSMIHGDDEERFGESLVCTHRFKEPRGVSVSEIETVL